MVNIKLINIICIIGLLFILISCGRFKDEDLKLERRDYNGNELRTDGYYYYFVADSSRIVVYYLYRNGIIMTSYSYTYTNFQDIEEQMIERYDLMQKTKTCYGVFNVNENTIQLSMWVENYKARSFKSIGVIDNDTTFRIVKDINSDGKEFECNDIYHFKQFSPKPDSTNNFIK